MPVSESTVVVDLVHATRQVPTAPIEPLIRHIVTAEGHDLGFVGVILADHDLVLELNKSYLNHHYHTDVLSFSLGTLIPGTPIEGEIYVDLDTAAECHTAFGATFEQEAYRYVVHGLLHLLGYTDHTPEEKAHMHHLEDRYLAQLDPLS